MKFQNAVQHERGVCSMAQELINNIAIKVVDNVDVMLGYWDRNLKCQFANAAYQVWFGKSRRDLLGSSIQDLLGPLYEMNLPYILAALEGKAQVFERTIPLPDGSTRHSLASYYPDIVNGEVCGFTVQVTDVTRLKRLELELQEAKNRAELMATHDFLTGLPNRVLLMDRIAIATARVRRAGGMFGIIAIDMDGFKPINDTYGHEAGDRVLREVAIRMKDAIRSTDTISRLGGDEFIFLVNDVGTIQGLTLAIQHFLDAVCRPVQLGAASVTPTLSCGVAVYPDHGSNEKELMAKADAALYDAKKRGKNCFVFCQ
ncbi:MAG TPA: GGDEF domain-containing protein [Candidatus Sulfotelmatobacter sp.]|nr:GGDEF domain-containing protein [Candidatus Sulfotelmatobacter sp.]